MQRVWRINLSRRYMVIDEGVEATGFIRCREINGNFEMNATATTTCRGR